jgi:hypothetical protein
MHPSYHFYRWNLSAARAAPPLDPTLQFPSDDGLHHAHATVAIVETGDASKPFAAGVVQLHFAK